MVDTLISSRRPRLPSAEDIVVRIKADAPVLRPDEPVPAQPVL